MGPGVCPGYQTEGPGSADLETVYSPRISTGRQVCELSRDVRRVQSLRSLPGTYKECKVCEVSLGRTMYVEYKVCEVYEGFLDYDV